MVLLAAVAAQAVLGLLGLVNAASTFSPARPPAVPLAVKSPYLSTWLDAGSDGGNGGYLAGEWPTFWDGQVTGWTGYIRVDGTPYLWLGSPSVSASDVTQTDFSYTSTRSTFIMDVGGKVQMNVTFLTPVTPDDLKRQSLVFSYVEVAVESADGNSHDVVVYGDVSGEWASGDDTAVINWSHNTADGVSYHTFARETQSEFTESNQQADWGTWYWSTADSNGLTYQIGQDTVVRTNFVNNGSLPDTVDTNYRAINSDWPVFAFAKDLGSVKGSASVLFSIGMTQDNAVSFLGYGSSMTSEPALWNSYFSNSVDAMTFFYNDYSTVSGLATTLDNKIASDSSSAGGQNYTTITTLALRQAYAGLQFAGNESAPLIFLKEISSDGDTSTVDVLFPAMPVILYTNPQLLAYMLDPLYINQEQGHYPNSYAEHDLGVFPVASGYPAGNDEQMPVEECGNMLIMTLAYAQRAGDTDYLKSHYTLLKQWTGYLVNDSLIPDNQISTDDFAGSLANQTNLALKGIIGIRAMAEIAKLTGNTDDASSYLSTAQSYIAKWQTYGIDSAATPPHTTLAYGQNTTWGLLYNLYANSLLDLGDFVPQSVYTMQSNFYPTVALEYGVPLDTRHTYTKNDWEMFCAAIAAPSTQQMFFGLVANWINTTPTNRPETDLYDADSGDYPGIYFIARPVVGGHFALLALKSGGSGYTS